MEPVGTSSVAVGLSEMDVASVKVIGGWGTASLGEGGGGGGTGRRGGGCCCCCCCCCCISLGLLALSPFSATVAVGRISSAAAAADTPGADDLTGDLRLRAVSDGAAAGAVAASAGGCTDADAAGATVNVLSSRADAAAASASNRGRRIFSSFSVVSPFYLAIISFQLSKSHYCASAVG